jgi:hypothetical protein
LGSLFQCYQCLQCISVSKNRHYLPNVKMFVDSTTLFIMAQMPIYAMVTISTEFVAVS